MSVGQSDGSAFADRPKHERLERIEGIYLDHRWAMATETLMDRLMSEPMSQTHAYGGIVVGPPGTGKSAVVERMKRKYPITRGERGKIMPVFAVDTPRQCTLKGMAQTILYKLGYPPSSRPSEATLTGDLLKRLERLQVRLLVIDEFHHLVRRDNEKTRQEVADWVKVLLNGKVCAIALVGTTSARNVMKGDWQLSRRCPNKLLIKHYDWEDAADREEFRLFLHRFDGQLPFRKRAGLAAEEIAKRMHHGTLGLCGLAAQVIHEAAKIAVDREVPDIGMDELADGYDKASFEWDDATPNPFRMKLSDLPATPPPPADRPDHR